MPDVLTRPGPVTATPTSTPGLVRCDLTDLYTTDCAHCRKIPDPPKPGRWYYAPNSGRCSYCGDQFDSGDRIRSNGHRGYLGPCCGDDDW